VIAGSAAREVQSYPEDPERVTAERTQHRRSAPFFKQEAQNRRVPVESQLGRG
jgi:hypothetical protein